jgi:predicted DCC family thiol-disulfide oxidoreductase YuxK
MEAKELIELSYKHPILFFDGECLLCQGSVQFLIKRDHSISFRYAHLQGNSFKGLLEIIPVKELPDSVVLLDNGSLFLQTDAVIQSMKYLQNPYKSLGFILRLIPKKIRNFFYNLIGKNRYRWFGKTDTCMMPSPEIKASFIDD